MGYLIDSLYVVRELIRLGFMIMISPLGLLATYFMMSE